MSFGLLVVLAISLLVAIEALNIWLGLWSDRVADRMRRRRARR
jgi:hypothetical protein